MLFFSDDDVKSPEVKEMKSLAFKLQSCDEKELKNVVMRSTYNLGDFFVELLSAKKENRMNISIISKNLTMWEYKFPITDYVVEENTDAKYKICDGNIHWPPMLELKSQTAKGLNASIEVYVVNFYY